jgi:hypothetical protein
VSGSNFLAFNTQADSQTEKASFASPQGEVELFAGTGDETDTFTLDAYAADNSLLASDVATPGRGIYADLSVSADDIAYVTFSTNGVTMVVDNLSYSAAVPEPASMLLLGAGLASLGAVRRKLR